MQKNNIKISVIVPVYNIESYLAKLIESVLVQSFKDFELILVNDGSTDSSLKVLQSYKKKDKRIKVISQNNKGAFAARNNALKIAKGEFVFFFDGDDYIEKNMLKEMYNFAIKYNANLVISGFYIHTYYDDDNYITLNYIPYTKNNVDIYNNKFEFRKFAYLNFDRNMFYPPWNKLFKLSYLKKNKITFPKTYRDDFPFVVSVIKDIDKVVITKKQYYHFIRKRSDSETQKYYKNLYTKREEEHKMMIDLYKTWNLYNHNESKEMISRRYIDRLIECIVNLYNYDCEFSDLKKRQCINQFLNSKYLDDALKFAKPKKIYLKLMYIPIKYKNTNLCIKMAKFINFIKKNNIKIFSILKTNR